MASTTTSGSSVSPSSSTPRTTKPDKATQQLGILDLPSETQHTIFSHCKVPELISLSVVSKHFHELAATQLYRSFHVVLATPAPPPRGSPPTFRNSGSSSLTGGLDTLTTSDYGYVSFLKHFSIDTRGFGEKSRPSHSGLQYSGNGGRFLNTLLHLALRDAKALETFKWNIPVELNRRVFKTLHQLPYLNGLHLRWHVGSSHYEPVRPLPLPDTTSPHSFDSPLPLHPHHSHSQGPPPPPPPAVFSAAPAGPQFYNNGLQSHFVGTHASPPTHIMPNIPPPTIAKPVLIPRARRRRPMPEDPPTLSGFKYLKHLSILNIDSQDLIPEIKSCISKSESTLSHLSLSFSGPLAQEAREADADQDPDATELDDDIHDAQHSYSSMSPWARKEWKAQEIALARILGVEKSRHKSLPSSQGLEVEDNGGGTGDRDQTGSENKRSPEEIYIAALTEASEKLLSLRGAESLSGHCGGITEVIEEAVGKYFEFDAAKNKVTGDDSNAADTGSLEQRSMASNPGESSTGSGSRSKLNKSPAASIDIHLSDTEEDEPLDTDPSDDPDASPDKTCSSGDDENDSHGDVRFDLPLTENARPLANSPGEQAKRTIEDDEAGKKELMSAYVKETRGLGLLSLKLHLIPVRPSILNSALDLHVLQTLTLLNVGNQVPLWTLLSKENKVQPLALRNISTDHVSPVFIKCVSQLDKLYELLLIERHRRYHPATFLPWTTVTINDIRRQVLKKHLPTLKRLMLRNDASSDWDLDAKTIMLLCTRGTGLEELSAGFHMRGVHILLQHFSGLRNLYALHISPFRNDDTCTWAVQETIKFFIDSLVRYPQHKLEWLGVNERARLVKRNEAKKPSKEETKKKAVADKKGKGKEVTVGGGDSGIEEVTLAFSADMWSYPSSGSSDEETSGGSEGESESEADDTGDEFEEMLKLRSVRLGLDFVEGVRIFEKEVRAGEL